jgi:HPt (histidine-containing phosphotransfer) domain-containing protein
VVSTRIDPSKIAELQAIMGADFEEIVGSLLGSITDGLRQIEHAVAAGDLETTYRAAHHCRNDALMVRAGPLLKALEPLEQAARDGHLDVARSEFERVQEVWPSTREALERLIERP